MTGGGGDAGWQPQDLVNAMERLAAKDLEASNTAVAKRIGEMIERLNEAEHKLKECEDQNEMMRGGTGRDIDATPQPPDPGPDPVPDPGPAPVPVPVPDPDEWYARYATSISLTQKNIDCIGIQTWSLCYATEKGVACWKAICAMMPPILLLLLQCAALVAWSVDSLHPTCTHDADCRAGMWCAPSKGWGSSYTRDPGMCDDCHWARLLQNQDYNSLPSRYNTIAAYAPIASSVANSTIYCVATDVAFEQCDYLVHFMEQMTVGRLFVLLFAISVLLFTVVVDMDRQHFVSEVFSYRAYGGPRPPRHPSSEAPEASEARPFGGSIVVKYIVLVLGWLAFTLRKIVLPGSQVLYFSSLVLGAPVIPRVPMSVSVFLASLATILLNSMDSILGHALLSGHGKAMIVDALADFEEHLRAPRTDASARTFEYVFKENNRSLAVSFHRFSAFCFGSLIIIHVLAAERLMGIDWDALLFYFASEIPVPKTCSSVPIALAGTTILVTVVLSLIWAINLGVADRCRPGTRCRDVCFSPVLGLVVLPVLALIPLHVHYIPFPE